MGLIQLLWVRREVERDFLSSSFFLSCALNLIFALPANLNTFFWLILPHLIPSTFSSDFDLVMNHPYTSTLWHRPFQPLLLYSFDLFCFCFCFPSQPTQSSHQDVNSHVLAPLWEVANAEAVFRVYVTFLLSDVSKSQKQLGFFTSSSANIITEFHYLFQSDDLISHDIYIIMSNTLAPEECRWVGTGTQLCRWGSPIDTTHPIGAETVWVREMNWDYNKGTRHQQQGDFQTCILAGLWKAIIKSINYDKLQEVIQDKTENPSTFLSHLTEAMLKYTNQDPETPETWQPLMTLFFPKLPRHKG